MAERAAEIVAEFSEMEDWVARYRHLVELGEAMAEANGEVRAEAHAIPGCEYDVWIRAEYDAAVDVLRFEADSDAKITRGIAALILRVVNGQPPEAVEAAELEFLDAIGLRGHLSARRATGLDAMVHWIRTWAREAKGGPEG